LDARLNLLSVSFQSGTEGGLRWQLSHLYPLKYAKYKIYCFLRRQSSSSTFWNAILTTAVFRCWHILIFGALSIVISATTHNLGMGRMALGMVNTLLTVFVRMLPRLDGIG
jgi:hypothetical protein